MPSETVTIPKEEYEELIETLEVLMDQDLLRKITISTKIQILNYPPNFEKNS